MHYNEKLHNRGSARGEILIGIPRRNMSRDYNPSSQSALVLDKPHNMGGSVSNRQKRSLNDLAKDNREAERNEQLLKNRIAMLDSEQARLLKKIDKTRARAA